MTLDRQCGEAWALKARLLSQRQGHERDALKAVTHAVALDAGGVDAVFLKAELLEIEGSTVAAEETLLKAIKQQPSNGELRARIAGHYLMLHRVEATVRPENAASRAVLAKAGFREEGLLKRYLEVDGAWRDHLLVALTVEELNGSVAATLVRAGRAAWT